MVKLPTFLKARREEPEEPPSPIEIQLDESALFDTDWYLSQYPDVADGGIRPIKHYLERGAGEGRDPNPFFSTEWYLETYPDVATAKANPLLHYLLHGAREGRDPHPSFSTSWYLGKYGDVEASGYTPLGHYLRVGRAEGRTISSRAGIAFIDAQLEPLARWEPELEGFTGGRVHLLRYSAPPTNTPLRRAVSSFLDEAACTYERFVLVPSLDAVDPMRAAAHLLRAAQVHGGAETTALLALDGHGEAAIGLPAGSHVHVASSAVALTPEERVLFLSALVTAVQPRAILNVESLAGWQAFQRFGRGFASVSQMSAMIAGSSAAPDVQTSAQWRLFLRQTIDRLARVYVGSRWMATELAELFTLLPSQRTKVVCLYEPYEQDTGDTVVQDAVLWSGYGSSALDLLVRLAPLMPEITFVVDDACCVGDVDRTRVFQQPNVHRVEKTLPTVRDTAIATHPAAVIYASPATELPSVLVRAALAGIPIVAPAERALQELVDGERGWSVEDATSPESFVVQIRELLARPDEARRRAEIARRAAQQRHSWTDYVERLAQGQDFL
jgi:glycosyltransferase involved in cell wall biosynthesis